MNDADDFDAAFDLAIENKVATDWQTPRAFAYVGPRSSHSRVIREIAKLFFDKANELIGGLRFV
jgi:hypothetical protein